MRVLRRFPVVIAVLMVAAIGVAGSASFQTPNTTTTHAVLHSTMLGANEVGHAGDPNAIGSAVVVLNSRTGLVCYAIRVSGLSSPPTAGHIHVGDAGTAGPVVIPFPLTGHSGNFGGCTHAAPALVQSIIDDPSHFYTNIHTALFPAGAIRGQLSPFGQPCRSC